jgi:hypothetical protein
MHQAHNRVSQRETVEFDARWAIEFGAGASGPVGVSVLQAPELMNPQDLVTPLKKT